MRLAILLLALAVTACAGPPSNTPPQPAIVFNGLPTGADTGSVH